MSRDTILYSVIVSCLLFLATSTSAQSIKDRINCPAKVKQATTKGDCGSNVAYTSPFSEMEKGELVRVQNNFNSQDYFEKGETTVYYKAADRLNNNYFCIFKVQVTDNEEPVFVSFPETVVLSASTHKGTHVSWSTPLVKDNCGSPSVFSSHQSGDLFPVGVTTVTYWIHDESGNHISKNFQVIVNESEAVVSVSR